MKNQENQADYLIKRDHVLDLAKGIAVVLMVQVHLMELFALPEVLKSAIGKILMFLGGPLVAPIFLSVFGYLVSKKEVSNSVLMIRGIKLLILAFILNIGLNFHLFLLFLKGTIKVNPWEFLFGVDILFTAGFSAFAISITRVVFRNMYIFYIITACLIVLVEPTFSRICTVDSGFKYFFAYIGGDYKWSYFPLFPWLAYPMMGYAVALMQNKFQAETIISERLKGVGFLLLLSLMIGSGYFFVSSMIDLSIYYHHGYKEFLWIILLLFLWLAFLKILDEQCGVSSFLIYFKWLGRNVTISYCIQWMIIGNIGTAVYKTQSLAELIIWFLLIMTTISSIIISVKKIRYFFS